MNHLAAIMNGGKMPTALPYDFKMGKLPYKHQRKVDECTPICSICGEVCETEVEVIRGNIVKVAAFVDMHPRCYQTANRFQIIDKEK